MGIEHWSMRRWHCLLIVGVVILSLSHTIDTLVGRPVWLITRAIYLGHESNLPTWYSAVLLFAGGLYAFWCYREAALRHIKPRRFWLVLSFILIGLSCDEVACLHEHVGGFLAQWVAPTLSAKFAHSGWPLVLGPIGLVVAAVVGWNLRSHLKGAPKAAWLMTAGAALLIGGGILLEFGINWLNHEELKWAWNVQVILEETAEMTGTWLIGLGILHRLALYTDRTPMQWPVS